MSWLLGRRSRFRALLAVVVIGCLLGGGFVVRTRGGGEGAEKGAIFSTHPDFILLQEALKLPEFYDTVDRFAQCLPILHMVVRHETGHISVYVDSPSPELNRAYEHVFRFNTIDIGLFELGEEDGGVLGVDEWRQPLCEDSNCLPILFAFFSDLRFRRQRIERDEWWWEKPDLEIQHMTVDEVPAGAKGTVKEYRLALHRGGFVGEPETESITFVVFFDTEQRHVTELEMARP